MQWHYNDIFCQKWIRNFIYNEKKSHISRMLDLNNATLKFFFLISYNMKVTSLITVEDIHHLVIPNQIIQTVNPTFQPACGY